MFVFWFLVLVIVLGVGVAVSKMLGDKVHKHAVDLVNTFVEDEESEKEKEE